MVTSYFGPVIPGSAICPRASRRLVSASRDCRSVCRWSDRISVTAPQSISQSCSKRNTRVSFRHRRISNYRLAAERKKRLRQVRARALTSPQQAQQGHPLPCALSPLLWNATLQGKQFGSSSGQIIRALPNPWNRNESNATDCPLPIVILIIDCLMAALAFGPHSSLGFFYLRFLLNRDAASRSVHLRLVV